VFRRYALIHRDLKHRKGYIGCASLREYEGVQERLPAVCKLHTVIAIQAGRDVAGLVFSMMGDTGIYLLGATHSNGLASKGSYLLQWRIISYLKEAGCRWYDLGGINRERNPGVYHFKSGITRNEVVSAGQYDFAPSIWRSLFVRLGDLARRMSGRVQG